MARLRIYSETLPFEELVRQETVALLARYGLEIVLAVRPWQIEALPGVATALASAGVPLSVWPMLGDEEGRWASAHNAQRFAALVQDVLSALERARVLPRDVLYDLEPPFAEAQSLASSRTMGEGVFRVATGVAHAPRRRAFADAEVVLAQSVADLHARGIDTSMAVWPLVALDPKGETTWQSILGTPVDALGAGHVSVMMYTSILEGWSRGALRRRDVTALLCAATQRSTRRWGERAGVSLGCVGTGAFEDEPIYRGPEELAEDAALARASGCESLSLFDLGGVLARGPAEAWLDAFVGTSSAEAPRPSKRVQAARSLARAATWALGKR